MRNEENNYIPQASKKQEITIQTDGTFPDAKNIAGGSVDEHKDLEVANAIVGGEEIRQQNENL
jgi:hypothetical protein